MRADARRNRQRILDAAAATFAAEGIAVPVDEVARRAGVGVGTLYRHFPTKEALFEAIVIDRVDTLLASASVVDESQDPAGALFSFLAKMAGDVSSKHDLLDALSRAGVELKERWGSKFDQLRAAIDVLRQRAVDGGAVRADVGTDELLSLVVGVCLGSKEIGAAHGCDRMLRVVCDGLRTRAAAEA